MYDLDTLTTIILAGGKGSRLRSVISDRPKVMAPVNKKPFVYILLEQLLSFGVNKIIFSTGYMSKYIKEQIGDSYKSQEILYSEESEPLGTGGAVYLASSRFPSKYFLILNGDNFVEYSLQDFFNFHLSTNSDASILTKKVDDARSFGSISFNSNNQIESFKEKSDDLKPAYINCGVYLFTSPILDLLPNKKPCSLEYDFFPKLVSKKFKVFKTQGRHLDIGTPESYKISEAFF